jgi:hypothetical protein
MAKKKLVPVPDYPPVLMAQGNAYTREDRLAELADQLINGAGMDRYAECLNALVAHYDLADFPHGNDEERAVWWSQIALSLAHDFVPAFREVRRSGAPSRWRKTKDDLFPHAHDARLVQIVKALQAKLKDRDLPATRTAAFRELITRLKKNPIPKWRYGNLYKVSSFNQAWKKIPENVKLLPIEYLPSKLRPASHFPSLDPSLPLDHLLYLREIAQIERQYNRTWDELPALSWLSDGRET